MEEINTEEESNKKLAEKQTFDMMNMDYILPSENIVVDFVGKYISFIPELPINFGKELSAEVMLKETFKNIELLGKDVIEMYKKIIPNTKIKIIPAANRFSSRCIITFANNLSTNEWEEEYHGAVMEFLGNYYQIDSISIGHEFIHLLKDTSYREVKNYIFIETLPIFFELLCYENERIMSDELLKYRLINLSRAYNKYKINHEKLFLSTWTFDNANSIERYICTTEASYLYSFYNAVILYNQYKVNPKETLELIKRVLEHRMTTKSLMSEISLNQNQRNEIFDKEIVVLKKVLK